MASTASRAVAPASGMATALRNDRPGACPRSRPPDRPPGARRTCRTRAGEWSGRSRTPRLAGRVKDLDAVSLGIRSQSPRLGPWGWSGRRDSNPRSRAPKARALPGYATPRRRRPESAGYPSNARADVRRDSARLLRLGDHPDGDPETGAALERRHDRSLADRRVAREPTDPLLVERVELRRFAQAPIGPHDLVQ
jgi:hypothetical protein